MYVFMNRDQVLSLLALLIFVLAGCSKDDGIPSEEEKDPAILLVEHASLGDILVDQDNQSMYFFAGDVTGSNNCSGGCAQNWSPVLGSTYEFDIDADLSNADFGTVSLTNGQKQLTYKGWPLYYFSPDGVLESTGATNGDGVAGLFHVAKPDYSLLVGQQVLTEGEDPVLYLVDENRVTLYINTLDEENLSNCSAGCAEVWPPFKKGDYTMVLPSSLNADDFTGVNREDNLGPQLAMSGHPLYIFKNDEEVPGNALGHGGGPAESFFVADPR